MTGNGDNPGVITHPPFIYVGALLLACGLEIYMPLGSGFLFASTAPFIIGCVVFFIGATLLVVCIQGFMRAGTNVTTSQPSTTIVTHGPYKYSRNPIYVGLTLLYVALALLLNVMWAFLLLPIVLLIMHYGVIVREEAYLTAKFPAEYQAYRNDVRRWF